MNNALNNSQWIVRFRPNPNTHLRLFCFPFAGGGTLTYREWTKKLPVYIELCSILLPGREKRIRETPISNMISLVRILIDQLIPYLDKPFAFLGHSMGAILAFEVARELRRRQLPQPNMLFLTGHSAPHLPPLMEPLYHLPDDVFLTQLQKRYQQVPQAIMEDDELRALMLPMLRADFATIDTYQYQTEPPLDCPIVVLGGMQDDISQEQLSAWSQHTCASFSLHMLPGGHFFINSEQQQVLQQVTHYLNNLPQSQLFMNIRSIVETQLKQTLATHASVPVEFDTDSYLDEFQLDSLAFTSMIVELESKVGFIPDTILSGIEYPKTVGDLIEMYERQATAP